MLKGWRGQADGIPLFGSDPSPRAVIKPRRGQRVKRAGASPAQSASRTASPHRIRSGGRRPRRRAQSSTFFRWAARAAAARPPRGPSALVSGPVRPPTGRPGARVRRRPRQTARPPIRRPPRHGDGARRSRRRPGTRTSPQPAAAARTRHPRPPRSAHRSPRTPAVTASPGPRQSLARPANSASWFMPPNGMASERAGPPDAVCMGLP